MHKVGEDDVVDDDGDDDGGDAADDGGGGGGGGNDGDGYLSYALVYPQCYQKILVSRNELSKAINCGL